VAIDVDVAAKDVPADRAHRLFEDLARRLHTHPDVVAVAFSNRAPVDSSTPLVDVVAADGATSGDRAPKATMYLASPEYFAATGVPMLGGRAFRLDDDAERPRVAIVNEAMADRLWAGDALGRRFRTTADGQPIEVVGVARNSRYRSPGEERGSHVYLPFAQTDGQSATVIVRTRGDARAALRLLDREIDAMPPLAGFFGRTLREHLAVYLLPSRLAAGLAAALGAVAMLIAAVGLYGLIACMVGQRRSEIAVRMALGATPDRIRAQLLGGSMRLLAPGLIVGVVGSVAVGRVSASLLYGVGAVDAFSLGSAVLLLSAVVIAASYLPARRAMRINPASALRHV
jgi:putative ABC transport system permease protein